MFDDDFTRSACCDATTTCRPKRSTRHSGVPASASRRPLQRSPSGREARHRRTPAPPVRWLRRSRLALLTGAALVVASGLVVTGVGVTHWESPESAAAATLHEAAAAAAADDGRRPAPTRRWSRRDCRWSNATSDGEHYGEGYMEPTTTITGCRPTSPRPGSGRRGPGSRRSSSGVLRRARPRPTTVPQSRPLRYRNAASAATSRSASSAVSGQARSGRTDIADLPRDPHALIRRIEAAPRAADTTDELHVFDTISGLLQTGLVPADLRSTMYEALATLPTSSSQRNRSRSTAVAVLRSVSRAGAVPSSTTSSSTEQTGRTSANGASRPGGSGASRPAR